MGRIPGKKHDPVMAALADRLRMARELLGYSQGKAAQECSGISQRDVSQLEAGIKRFVPPVYMQFLNVRGIDLNSLFGPGPVRFLVGDSAAEPVRSIESELVTRAEFDRLVAKLDAIVKGHQSRVMTPVTDAEFQEALVAAMDGRIKEALAGFATPLEKRGSTAKEKKAS